MFKRKGFTLLELIIVVIIIGVLAGIAIPQYLNAVEKAKIAKAKANVTMIAQAEKMYHLNESTYHAVAADADWDELEAVTQGIKGTMVSDTTDWDYGVAAVTDIKNDFEVTAQRKGGAYIGKEITLDHEGTLSVDASFP